MAGACATAGWRSAAAGVWLAVLDLVSGPLFQARRLSFTTANALNGAGVSS